MDLNFYKNILHWILLRLSMEKEVGLFHGKMGIVLFLSHYFKYNGDQVYEDIANELMEELCEEIHCESPIGFASGLSGIGWGIEYLLQNNFFEGDSLELCEEIDEKIIAIDPRTITDFSLDTGLEGLLHYILMHIKGNINQCSQYPFDKIYLERLYNTTSAILKNDKITNDLKILCDIYVAYYENRVLLNYSPKLTFFIEDNKISMDDNFIELPLGLRNGLSGFLLNEIYYEGNLHHQL